MTPIYGTSMRENLFLQDCMVTMLQAISTFQNQQTGYQAALQSYAMVQRMSLFDYVK